MKSTEELKKLRAKSVKELYKDLSREYTELRQLNFNVVNKKQKNVNASQNSRKTVARILTILTEKLSQKDSQVKPGSKE